MSKFLFGGDKPLASTTLQRRYEQDVAKTNLPYIKIHDIRHSYVGLLIHLGFNYSLIARLIGDTVETVIKTYEKIYGSDRKRVSEKIDIEYGTLYGTKLNEEYLFLPQNNKKEPI